MNVASGSPRLAHWDRLPSWQEKLPHTLAQPSVTRKAVFSVRLTPVTGHCSRHPQCVTFTFFSFLIFLVIFFFSITSARDCVGGKASCLSLTPSASQRDGECSIYTPNSARCIHGMWQHVAGSALAVVLLTVKEDDQLYVFVPGRCLPNPQAYMGR